MLLQGRFWDRGAEAAVLWFECHARVEAEVPVSLWARALRTPTFAPVKIVSPFSATPRIFRNETEVTLVKSVAGEFAGCQGGCLERRP